MMIFWTRAATRFGLANVELNVPMQVDHVFGTGSITKQVTAVAILQLVEKGALSLDDDARRYVPALPTDGRLVTIDQLLSHTSGLPNAVDRPDFDAIARLDYTVDQLLTLTNGMPMHFAPGTRFHYSDTGYFALGAIVERISGRPYATYVLVNNDGDVPDAGGTARRLARLMVTGAPHIAPYPLTAQERAVFVGRYVTPAGDDREIRDDAGALSEVRAGVRRPLVALSPTTLAWAEGEEGVVLTFDAIGKDAAPQYRAALRCEPMDEAARRP